MSYPIIIGGNGHSGTRIFAEVLAAGGASMGIPRLTRSHTSFDLNIRELLHRWVGPYLHARLSPADLRSMRREFATRLRVYFPFRTGPWGFKNPRTMLLLPFLAQMFPGMKFIHVVRDGRDVTLGNVLAGNEEYISAFMTPAEAGMSAEERMITFWGRSNARAQQFAEQELQGRYLRMRFEDLCEQPLQCVPELLTFAGLDAGRVPEIAQLVKKPKSVGRWRDFDGAVVAKVQVAGRPWLTQFGYEQA